MVAITRKGLREGNYTSWTKKWFNAFTNSLHFNYYFDTHIDEKNEVIVVSWKDGSGDRRLGVYKISDFSVVYESPAGSDYMYRAARMDSKYGITSGMVYLDAGGISRALQTYLLLQRADEYTVEVWRGGNAPLWSRNTRTDFGTTCYCYGGAISLTGRYVLLYIKQGVAPWGYYLMLYDGH